MLAYMIKTRQRISVEQLQTEGIEYQHIDPQQSQGVLNLIKNNRGYIHQDHVSLTPETPNLDTLLETFAKEHSHCDDEIRYITEGSGIFDIRSSEDEWIRVEVKAGDYIAVPAGRNHRFLLTEEKTITAVRLFKDKEGWTARYRL